MAAVGFYERMGFAVVTEPFDKPEGGPHRGMVVDLSRRLRAIPRELTSGCGLGHTSGERTTGRTGSADNLGNVGADARSTGAEAP